MNIAGIGLVSALGCDAATSCAAARAGLVRSRVLDNFALRSAVDGEAEPVIGHPVSLLTRGFEGDARLMRLLQGALTDLLADTADFPWAGTVHRVSTCRYLIRDASGVASNSWPTMPCAQRERRTPPNSPRKTAIDR